MSGWYCRTVFFTKDVKKSLQMYENDLGFTKKWQHDEEGRIIAAQVDRNGLEIILNKGSQEPGQGRIFMSIGPGETEALADEFQSSGVEVSNKHWGMPVMKIADMDGNELYFTDDEFIAANE